MPVSHPDSYPVAVTLPKHLRVAIFA
jgi:hypothetical protein